MARHDDWSAISMEPMTELPSRRALPERASVEERLLTALLSLSDIAVAGSDYEAVVADLVQRVASAVGARSGRVMLHDENAGELVAQSPAFDGSDELHQTTRLLSVALKIGGRAIGVFHAVDKLEGDFSAEDAALLTMIAPHLASTLESAVMLRRLGQQERELRRMVHVHDELIDMMVTGEGRAAVVLRLAALVDMPIVLLDPSGALLSADVAGLAAAGIELDRLERAMTEVLKSVHSSSRGHRAATRMGSDAILVPIQIGDELLGYLAALEVGGHHAGHEDIRVMEQAAMLFALDSVRTREVVEARRRLDSDTLDQVFAAASEDEAVELLSHLRVVSPRGYRAAVIQFERRPATRAGDFQTRRDRMLRWLSRVLAQPSTNGVVVERGESYWIVLPEKGIGRDRGSQELRTLAGRLAAQDAPGEHFLMGVGGVCERAVELQGAFEQANNALTVARRFAFKNVAVFYDELGVHRILGQPAGADELRSFVAAVIGPVIEYDESNKTDWTSFLATLVAANFSLASTASRTQMHINTVKYRCARLQDLMGREFGNANDRLEIQLALEINAGALREPGADGS